MTPEPRDNPPLAFRRLILMPWRWSRWTWGAIAIVWLVYPLTGVPAVYCIKRAGFRDSQWLAVYRTAYAPLAWAEQEFPPVPRFTVWQFQTIERLFGPTPPAVP